MGRIHNRTALDLRDTDKINERWRSFGECLTIFSWRVPYNEIKLGNMYNLAALDLRDINKTNERWCSFSRYCLSVKLETNLVLWGVV